MALVENRFVCDLSKPVQAQALKGNVFSLDNLGSRLSVLIYNNGQPATISGSVTANCILPDGSTVNVNGVLTTENGGSKAYVDVPQSCLLIPGILKIAIKCISSSVITTLAAIVANVYMTKTDNVITPSQQVITDWNSEISAAIATQNAAIANQDTKIDVLKSAISSEEKVLQSYNSAVTLLNGYYNASTGVFVENSGFRCTNKIPYFGIPVFSVNPRNCNVWNGGEYVGRYLYADFGTVPAHDTISFTWTSDAVPSSGITMTPEGDLYKAVSDSEEDINDILNNGKLSVSWEQGGYIIGSGGNWASNARIRITEKLTSFSKIICGTGYEFLVYVWDGSTYKGCFNGSGFSTSTTYSFTELLFSTISSYVSGFTSPKYGIVGKNTSGTDLLPSAGTNFTLYDGDYVYTYNELQNTVKTIDNEGTNPFKGKTLVVDGSSIMAGAGYSGGWAKIIGDTYGMTVTNRAVNGATIANTEHHSLATSIDTTPVSDYFIFDTMRNDYVDGVEFGTPSDDDDYSPTLDKTTFCGAFEYVCQKLASTYGTEKLGYVFAHRRPPIEDDLVNTWKPYAIRTLKKWGIPYIDLEELDPPIGFISALYENYTASSDRVHPNQQGYEIFYVPKIVAWMKTL